jgi:hypothetical protein
VDCRRQPTVDDTEAAAGSTSQVDLFLSSPISSDLSLFVDSIKFDVSSYSTDNDNVTGRPPKPEINNYLIVQPISPPTSPPPPPPQPTPSYSFVELSSSLMQSYFCDVTRFRQQEPEVPVPDQPATVKQDVSITNSSCISSGGGVSSPPGCVGGGLPLKQHSISSLSDFVDVAVKLEQLDDFSWHIGGTGFSGGGIGESAAIGAAATDPEDDGAFEFFRATSFTLPVGDVDPVEDFDGSGLLEVLADVT